MASVKALPRFDAAEYLDNDEAVAIFMSEAMGTADPTYIAHAFGIVARAKGMSKIAEDTGLSREQLYRSFSENGNPTLKTVLSVMKSLGLELRAQPRAKKHAMRLRTVARAGGSGDAARTDAKRESSQKSGRKGGRPRKATIA